MEKVNIKLSKWYRNNPEISTLIIALLYLITLIVTRLSG